MGAGNSTHSRTDQKPQSSSSQQQKEKAYTVRKSCLSTAEIAAIQLRDMQLRHRNDLRATIIVDSDDASLQHQQQQRPPSKAYSTYSCPTTNNNTMCSDLDSQHTFSDDEPEQLRMTSRPGSPKIIVNPLAALPSLHSRGSC